MRDHFVCIMLMISALLASCAGGASDLKIVSKTLRRDVNASTAGGLDLGTPVPSTSSMFWVEGTLRNSGTKALEHVTISFRLTDGRSTTVLTAEIPSIAPGATADFHTSSQASRTELHLVEEDPEVNVGG
ncbi:MAG TPA: FxLYD domain-containing protein [Bacteroidota bacterium]|nr:FxLYD domain-containing protein [Bacteroidota bacterium]